MRGQFIGILSTAALVWVGVASAQAPTEPRPFACGDVPNPKSVPKVEPIFHATAGLNNAGFDCMAWQDFIYLNWPAEADHRGVPDAAAKFGQRTLTVWESYKTSDQVFLPDARDPGPWDRPQLLATLTPSLAARVAQGAVRNLTMTSKVSRGVMANVLRNSGAIPEKILDDISQAGGGTLYDLNGYPVYYEIAMNKGQYEYIVQNGLYNADTQRSFAGSHVISLPTGEDGESNSVEVKAAWKVLSDAEKNSGRFHTIEALINGGKTTVTVGLVGFHVFVADGGQGAWGTFAQVDNAPVATPATSGTFNFFNPACVEPGTAKPCPYNVKDADPGQVVQIKPDDPTADGLNTYMKQILRQYDANTPWQYYKLVNVQWPLHGVGLSSLKVPAAVPLPSGDPNTPTLVNAVLETFLQKEGTGCIGCHEYATTSQAGGGTSYAAGYSFAFGQAAAPK